VRIATDVAEGWGGPFLFVQERRPSDPSLQRSRRANHDGIRCWYHLTQRCIQQGAGRPRASAEAGATRLDTPV
jgi:hypothetical protein